MQETRGRHAVDGDPVREETVRLGPAANLIGILSRPAAIDARAGSGAEPPAIVMLNAGVLHRVGPHRMHVALARRLAARGHVALRLDLAGIGDSLAVAGAESFRASAVADTRAAMDGVAAETGASRFVLFGLCSGADNALATALADERVVGLVLLDPPTYRTRRSQARSLARKLGAMGGPAAIARWGAAVAQRRLRALAARVRDRVRARGGGDEPEQSEGREIPPRPVYREMLHALVARRVRLLAIFSGALGDRYDHADHLYELFPELRADVDRVYFPEANHMFTERWAQTALLDAVTAWIARSFARA